MLRLAGAIGVERQAFTRAAAGACCEADLGERPLLAGTSPTVPTVESSRWARCLSVRVTGVGPHCVRPDPARCGHTPLAALDQAVLSLSAASRSLDCVAMRYPLEDMRVDQYRRRVGVGRKGRPSARPWWWYQPQATRLRGIRSFEHHVPVWHTPPERAATQCQLAAGRRLVRLGVRGSCLGNQGGHHDTSNPCSGLRLAGPAAAVPRSGGAQLLCRRIRRVDAADVLFRRIRRPPAD